MSHLSLRDVPFAPVKYDLAEHVKRCRDRTAWCTQQLLAVRKSAMTHLREAEQRLERKPMPCGEHRARLYTWSR
jgi:hypothetical protein